MRDYIFHGKRIDTNEWVEGYLGYNKVRKQYYIMDDVDSFPIPVLQESVGQYTGMNDKNGKKIFDGDIIKTKYGRLCIVVWFSSPTYVGWDLKVVETVDNCLHTRKPDFSDLYYSDNLEIVGNIHDNPELLEVEL